MKQWYSRRRHSKVWEIERNWADGPRGVPKCRTFKEIGRRQTNPPSLPSNAAQLVTQFTTDSRARLFSACALQNLDFLTASHGRGSDWSIFYAMLHNRKYGEGHGAACERRVAADRCGFGPPPSQRPAGRPGSYRCEIRLRRGTMRGGHRPRGRRGHET